jgi:hypothetical protein
MAMQWARGPRTRVGGFTLTYDDTRVGHWRYCAEAHPSTMGAHDPVQCYGPGARVSAIQPYHPTGSADRHRAVCVDRLVQRSLTARSNLGEFRDDPVVNAGQRPAYPGGPEARVLGPEQSRGVSR